MRLLAILFGLTASMTWCSAWPLWESYASYFINAQGRVIDRDSNDRTTSEAQAYAMFFALVANDTRRFDLLLRWTQDNLAKGDLGAQLPAWLWGKSDDDQWGIRDENSASDADLWIVYTLLEAGARWQRSDLSALGVRLARLVAGQEVAVLPGLGEMLLPGPHGFQVSPNRFVLNPSYLPLQLLIRLAEFDPSGPWAAIAARVPQMVTKTSPKGFPLDWVSYQDHAGFIAEDAQGNKSISSYDAVRVYLWTGMLDPDTSGRAEMLAALGGMAKQLRKNPLPPSAVTHDGKVRDAAGGIAFSASVIPYLRALGEHRTLTEQLRRLSAEWNPVAGLYGAPPRYYDQNLAMFATGWHDGLYSFGRNGSLRLPGRKTND